MSQIITCYTLFDCTKTGVRQRSKIPDNLPADNYIYKRNTQANLDTILQIISLRSQPELIRDPIKIIKKIKTTEFGFMYEINEESCNVWFFDFEVQHASVFNNNVDLFGHLFNDCDKIPMIKCKDEHPDLSNFLDISPELRNIYFEIK